MVAWDQLWIHRLKETGSRRDKGIGWTQESWIKKVKEATAEFWEAPSVILTLQKDTAVLPQPINITESSSLWKSLLKWVGEKICQDHRGSFAMVSSSSAET